MSYEEGEDTCMSYEEDTCMSYEEEDRCCHRCVSCGMRRSIHACHMRRRRTHACHMRRIHACHMRRRRDSVIAASHVVHMRD
jgi:hypothetical protein